LWGSWFAAARIDERAAAAAVAAVEVDLLVWTERVDILRAGDNRWRRLKRW
jgi:hypothetical protein